MSEIIKIIEELRQCKKEFKNSLELEKFVKNSLKKYKIVGGNEFDIKGTCTVSYYIEDLDIVVLVQEDVIDLDENNEDNYVSIIKHVKAYAVSKI